MPKTKIIILFIVLLFSCIGIDAQDNHEQEPAVPPKPEAKPQPPQEPSELSPIIGEPFTPRLTKHFKIESCLSAEDNDTIAANAEKCYEIFKQLLSITDDEVIWHTFCRLWIVKNKDDYMEVIEHLTQGQNDPSTLRWKETVHLCQSLIFYQPFPLEVGRADMPGKDTYVTAPLPVCHGIVHLLLYYWTKNHKHLLWVEEGLALYLSILIEKDSVGCMGSNTIVQEANKELWRNQDNWRGLLVDLVKNEKDTPLEFLAKRTDPNDFRSHEKAKIWSVLSFMVQHKQPAKDTAPELAKEQNPFRKFILSLKTQRNKAELEMIFDSMNLEELDKAWKDWIS